jgi:hypothetical protein
MSQWEKEPNLWKMVKKKLAYTNRVIKPGPFLESYVKMDLR